MNHSNLFEQQIQHDNNVWLITGVAGFVGSHLLEALLNNQQYVLGIDNFSTGSRLNLDIVRARVGEDNWKRFDMHNGDIRDKELMSRLCVGGIVNVVHLAALYSAQHPMGSEFETFSVNTVATEHLIHCAIKAKVSNFIFASSSSVYGNADRLPNREIDTPKPISPYAKSKHMAEHFIRTNANASGVNNYCLRLYNVYGPRQDVAGMIGLVIPTWINAMRSYHSIYINGDRTTLRDYCYIDDVVSAILLSALQIKHGHVSEVLNIASGYSLTLLELFSAIQTGLNFRGYTYERQPIFIDPRLGDVRLVEAYMENAKRVIGYSPKVPLSQGVSLTVDWYLNYS